MAVNTQITPPVDEAVLDKDPKNMPGTDPSDDLITTPRGTAEVGKGLVHMVERSAQSLRHAAESVENRGLKLFLKVMAQERAYMHNALRQASGYRAVDALDPSAKSPATSLQEGLQELQSSMTVKQQGRENVALTHLLDEEEKLIEAYNAALQSENDATTRELLTVQRDRVAGFVTRLTGVDYGVEPIVARVFDTRVEGESAVTRLRARGMDAAQIDALPINQIAHPALYHTGIVVAPKRSPLQTMMAGALVGALCGGIFGLALAAFVWMAPQLIGWVTVGGWQLLIGSIIAGAFGGTVFGFFIGQNQKEIDQSVTADSLINGEMLVVAYPSAGQIAEVEDVLQVHHARELNR